MAGTDESGLPLPLSVEETKTAPFRLRHPGDVTTWQDPEPLLFSPLRSEAAQAECPTSCRGPSGQWHARNNTHAAFFFLRGKRYGSGLRPRRSFFSYANHISDGIRYNNVSVSLVSFRRETYRFAIDLPLFNPPFYFWGRVAAQRGTRPRPFFLFPLPDWGGIIAWEGFYFPLYFSLMATATRALARDSPFTARARSVPATNDGLSFPPSFLRLPPERHVHEPA